jgi:hypothetical protein
MRKTLLLALLLLYFGFSGQTSAQVENLPKGQFLPAIENGGIIKPAPQTAFYLQDFRNSSGGFELKGWNWQNGIGVSAQTLSHNATYILQSGEIRLPELAAANLALELYIKERFEIESQADYGVIEIKTPSSAWQAVDIRSGTTQGKWHGRFIDLSRFAGQSIQIRFRLQTDESILGEGWSIEKLALAIKNRNWLRPEALVQKRAKGVLSPMQNCLNANVISVNTQSFPNNIYLNVRVTNERGEPVRGLTPEQFRLLENGDPQACVQLIPPGQGGSMRRADVVFIMDNSGSLEDEQDQVKTNVNIFVDALVNSGVDFALGLVRYGQFDNNGFPILEDNGVLTTNATYFKNQVWARNVTDGGNEPAYDALVDAANGMQWRPNSQRIIILITDESPVYDYNPCITRTTYQTLQSAQNALLGQGITLYVLADTLTGGVPYQTRCAATNNQLVSYPSRVDNRANFMPLVQATGGVYYPILDPFSVILNNIASQITSSYVLSYRSCNPASEVNRNLELLVSQNASCSGRASLNFTPAHCPYIELTSATQNLLGTAQQPGTTVTIAAKVGVAPGAPAPTVKLWYRASGTANYTGIPMVLNANGEYAANVQAVAPGIDFYILAEGACLSSFPSFDPQGSPHQIAAAPHTPLSVNHFPPQPPYLNQNVTIGAEILNNAPGAVSATLYYKKSAETSFSQLPMQLNAGQYTAVIPASFMTEDCIEYYIIAENSQGIRRIYPANGTELLCESPLRVQISSEEACPKTERNGTVRVCVEGSRPPYKVTIGGVTQVITSCGVFNNLPAGAWNVYVSQNSCCAPVRSAIATVGGCNLDSCMAITSAVVNDGCRPQCAALNCTGSIDLTVTRGKAPFTFSWSNGADTEDLSNLCPGVYTVNAKDSRGCRVSQTFTIAPKMQGSLTKREPTCDNNGSITASITGGTPPYQYALQTEDRYTDSSTFNGLESGEYTIFVRDAAGCRAMYKITLNAYNPLRILLKADSVKCYGGSTGSITSIVTGGNAPYRYSWSNNATEAHLVNIPAGVYTLHVTDASGCQVSQSVTVYENPELRAEFVVENGCIRALPRGGSPAYLMQIDSNGFVRSLEACNLAPGAYLVTIKDSKCCLYRQHVTVTAPARVCQAPAPPTVNEISAHSALVSWSLVTGIEKYEVSYRPIGGTNWIEAGTVNGTNRLTLTGLTPATRYEVRVRSVCDSDLTSSWARTGFSTSLAASTCGAVEGLRITASGTTALLIWNAVSNAVSYEVSFRLSGATTWSLAGNTAQPQYSLTGLQPGRVYEISVRAMCQDRSMGEPARGVVTIPTSPNIASCDTISNFRILQVGSSAASINFTRVAGALNHVAEICEWGTSECIIQNVHTTNTITGLSPGKVYTIRIRAVFSINGQLVFCDYNIPRSFRTANARLVSENVGMAAITAYPNPTSGILQVELQANQAANLLLSLVNLQGQIVWERSVWVNEGNNELELEISNLPAGIYTLKEASGAFSALRIIKR